MTYRNTYKPPSTSIDGAAALRVPADEYDFNFVFPVSVLRSDRVELRPFVPSLHGQMLYDLSTQYPETQDYLPFNCTSVEVLVETIEARRRDPSSLQYAIYTGPAGADAPPTDPSEYVFAGTMSCINSSATDLTAEPGWIIVFPPFQVQPKCHTDPKRTHVLTHAAGTLVRHMLNSPSEGGLGLRRCQWFCASLNEPSKKAALRLGFKFEGLLRNHRVLPPGKKGARDGRPDDNKPGHPARDSWLASITWNDWEEGTRAHIDALMARRQ